MAQQIFAGGKARAPGSLVAGCKKRATPPPAKRSSQTVKVISEQCLMGVSESNAMRCAVVRDKDEKCGPREISRTIPILFRH
jgi:hypothetical protein